MNNTATTGNPAAEDGYGPADTVRNTQVSAHSLKVGDTVRSGFPSFQARTVADIKVHDNGRLSFRLDNGKIETGKHFNRVTHFLGNGLTA